MFSCMEDYGKTLARMDAFWACELADRPLINLAIPRRGAKSLAERKYPDEDSRWLDVEYRAEQAALAIENTEYLADGLPVAIPQLGPGIYSAWHGCPYRFTATTGWNEAMVEDWDRDMPKVKLDPQHPLYRLTHRYMERLMELGKGKFIVGLTDIHFGADHLAAVRGTLRLCVDLLERPEAVEAALEADFHTYLSMYDDFYDVIKAGGNLACTWIGGLFGRGRMYVPSNDFSCMISTEMFERFFLDRLVRECEFLDQSIYHLDGPGALRHLDMILGVKKLNAVQWVCGAGNEGYARWIPVYQKIQRAGKALQLNITVRELPLIFETLRPEGVHFASIHGVYDRETAHAVIQRIAQWK